MSGSILRRDASVSSSTLRRDASMSGSTLRRKASVSGSALQRDASMSGSALQRDASNHSPSGDWSQPGRYFNNPVSDGAAGAGAQNRGGETGGFRVV